MGWSISSFELAVYGQTTMYVSVYWDNQSRLLGGE